MVHSAHAQFLSGYHGDIALPTEIPPWLWGGEASMRHPSFNTRTSQPPATESDVARNQVTVPNRLCNSPPRSPPLRPFGTRRPAKILLCVLVSPLLQQKSREQTATFLQALQSQALRTNRLQLEETNADSQAHSHSVERLSLTISALALEGLELEVRHSTCHSRTMPPCHTSCAVAVAAHSGTLS